MPRTVWMTLGAELPHALDDDGNGPRWAPSDR